MAIYLRLLTVCAVVLLMGDARAQTVNLVARDIRVGGVPLEDGKLCVHPVDEAQHLIVSDLGLPSAKKGAASPCALIERGALQSGFTIPDTSLTQPKNVCLRITVADKSRNGTIVLTAPCVHPSSSGDAASGPLAWCSLSGPVTTCDFDKYRSVAGPNAVSEGPPSDASSRRIRASVQTYAGGVFKAEEFAGLNFSDKVNACLEAVESNGGGACDARGLDGTQSVSTSIVVGDGAHGTTLLLPTGEIEFAVGTRLIYRSWATITGMGDGERGTVIICHATEGVGCVQSFDEASHQLQFPHLSEFRVKMTGPAVSGSIGLAIGGKENADVLSGKFEDIFSSGFDVGVEAGGAWGCTCYNRFDHVGGTGKSYGVLTRNFSHYGGDFNSNTWTGGWAWGDTGLADEVGGGNRWIGVDIENSHGHGFILGGAKTIVINPYEEGTGPDLLNGSNNMVIASWPWTPSQDSKCVTCSWMTGTSALTAESYYPSIAHDLVLSYDMIPRASGYTVYDQSGNGYNADLGYRGAGYWRVWTRNGLWDDGGWKSTTPAIPARIPVGSAPRTLVVWFSTTNTKTSEIGGWGTNGPLKKFAIRITEGRVGLDDYSGPPVPGPAVNVADGKWHMVVATYDGNSVSLTVDGSASSSTPRREDTDASAVTSSGDPGGAGFTGQMGYLGIYAVALNPTEIRALYQDFIAKRGISPINSDPAEPTSSIGRVVPHSTNAGGAVTDLHAATETTITFADHGFGNAAFCVASANVSLSLAPAVAQISLREVTFRFPPLTGSLYYNCTGN